MTKDQKIIRAKAGLLELAMQLGNVSGARIRPKGRVYSERLGRGRMAGKPMAKPHRAREGWRFGAHVYLGHSTWA